MKNCSCTSKDFCGKCIAAIMPYSMVSNLEFNILNKNLPEFDDIKYDEYFSPANFSY